MVGVTAAYVLAEAGLSVTLQGAVEKRNKQYDD
jgi:glycine/D-amino acid oxidase-like deaminating enzyme